MPAGHRTRSTEHIRTGVFGFGLQTGESGFGEEARQQRAR